MHCNGKCYLSKKITEQEKKDHSPVSKMVSGISSKHCQIVSLNDNDLAIVWNENFINKNNSSSRIGIEIRNAKGSDPVKDYITSETGNATFPTIKSISKNAALVAYTETENNKDFVKYKVVTL